MRTKLLLLSCLIQLALAVPSTASVMAVLDPGLVEVEVGESFEVEIRADLSLPVLGFGLDLDFDPTAVALSGSPVVGPAWLPVAGSDGDGLAGAAFPAGISGDDILLATVLLRALRPGNHLLALGVTPGDLTEGFPLDPDGFDPDVSLGSGTVQALPEPRLLVWIAAALMGSRNLRRRLV